MRNVVPFSDNIYCMLKVFYVQWQWREGRVWISGVEIASWTMKQLFYDQKPEMKTTDAAWLRVSLEGRGSCGINHSPGIPHAVKGLIQPGDRGGYRYNSGERQIRSHSRIHFRMNFLLRMSYQWDSEDKKLNSDRVRITSDKLTGLAMQYSKRYFAEAFLTIHLLTCNGHYKCKQETSASTWCSI